MNQLFAIAVSFFASVNASAQGLTQDAQELCELAVRAAVEQEARQTGRPLPQFLLSEAEPVEREVCVGRGGAEGCTVISEPGRYLMVSSPFGHEDGYISDSGVAAEVLAGPGSCSVSKIKISWGNAQ